MFSAFHERFPEIGATETRMVHIVEGGRAVDTFAFVELYCDEEGCDCRRVIVHVRSMSTGALLATLTFGWESNLRYLVPRLLDGTPAAGIEATRELGEVATDSDSPRNRYVLLGLVDWCMDRPDKPQLCAQALEVALEGRTGAIRRAAVDLAARMGRREILEALAGTDPDAGVRRRAAKALQRPHSRTRGAGQQSLF